MLRIEVPQTSANREVLPVRPQFGLAQSAGAMLLVLLSAQGIAAQQPAEEPLTVAETSNYQATSRSAEVVEFLDVLEKRAEHLRVFEFGRTVEGRPLQCVTVARPAVTRPEQLAGDPRAVVLVLGNIHSGECAGKEAMLMLLRELAGKPDHPWLQDLVLLFVPNYSADANDMVSQDNRPGQIGPSVGMGRRENAQGLDLNRDYMKLDSPECRALVRLVNQWDPHVFIDMHTTNGSWHRYALTYDVPHNPASPEPMRQFMRGTMMPAITADLQQKGIATFYYGNFNRDHTRWSTFGDFPRFGTEYIGVRGRMSILGEAYAYIPYEQRIVASREFLRQCLTEIAARREPICQLLADVRSQAPGQPGDLVPLRSQVTALSEQFVVRGYEPAVQPRGSRVAPTKPRDYTVEFLTRYEPTVTATRPLAYVVPAQQTEIVERLRLHGITCETLQEAQPRQVEIYRISSLSRAERQYQNRYLLQLQVEAAAPQTRTIPAGAVLVPTAQPLSALIVLLLEPEASDGLATWNVFQPELQVDQEYPVWRIVENLVKTED